MTIYSKLCGACCGEVREVSGPDRTFSSRGRSYIIPADLSIPTCESCGTRWINEAIARRLTEVVEAEDAARLASPRRER